MELEQLRYFLKIAELESFTQAAQAVNMSQSAVSRSVARLEEEIGRPLIERLSRKAVLNDTGRLFLERAKQILAMIDDVKSELSDDGVSGNVRIAAIPTIAPFYLPERLQSFQKSYPKAHLVIQEDTTENLLKKINSGEVDIAIAALPIEGKYLDIHVLFEEELFLVVGKNNPLAKKKSITAMDIQSHPFVLLGEAHCLSANVISFCRKTAFHPVSVERTSQLAMVQELVALDHGISLVPAMARARDNSKSRVYRSLSVEKPRRSIVMITNPYRYQNRLVKAFQKHLRQK